jgi:serine/threonine protein kinase
MENTIHAQPTPQGDASIQPDAERDDVESPYAHDIATDDVKDALGSPQSFYTATPGTLLTSTPGRLGTDTEYGQLLAQNDLLVAKEVEMNWSGRGQHVQYATNEPVPLEPLRALGHSATALVEAVECRRIILARKSVRLNRNIKLEELVSEIKHLHRLHHRHVIQLVGSYTQGKTFSMLLYPVAYCNLGTYMDWFTENVALKKGSDAHNKARRFGRSMLCLARALVYIHSQGVKHLDIKPANILINPPGAFGGYRTRLKVYM